MSFAIHCAVRLSDSYIFNGFSSSIINQFKNLQSIWRTYVILFILVCRLRLWIWSWIWLRIRCRLLRIAGLLRLRGWIMFRAYGVNSLLFLVWLRFFRLLLLLIRRRLLRLEICIRLATAGTIVRTRLGKVRARSCFLLLMLAGITLIFRRNTYSNVYAYPRPDQC